MILVTVQLVSGRSGELVIQELARMGISNTGKPSSDTKHNYSVETYRGRSREQLHKFVIQREAKVKNWPRDSLHIWNLVAYSLKKMGYGKPKKKRKTAGKTV